MNDDQITALSREYAEETGKEFPTILDIIQRNMKNHLRWLLLRYALVEKENIKKYFQSRNYILTHQDKYEVYIVRESEVEMKLLRCIFPEIAKEVGDDC